MNDLMLVLQRLYGFKNPVIVKKIEIGYKAASFVIQDGKHKFFVKKYHPKRSPERLIEIHKVKNFFNDHGVPTIPPLVNSEGTTFSALNGEFFSVFPYISDTLHYALPSDKAVASAGKNLAKLHLARVNNLSLVTGKVMKPWNREAFLESASKMFKFAESGTSFFDRVAHKMLKLKIELAKNSCLVYEDLGLKNNVILHGDYHLHNLFFNENDIVSFTYDFERTMVGPRATDIAYGLFMICFDFNTDIESNVSDVHFERGHSFIRAYNEVFPIGKDEFIKGLRWFFWSQMVYIQWPLDVHYFDHDTRADKLLSKRLNRLEYFSDNFEDIQDVLSRDL